MFKKTVITIVVFVLIGVLVYGVAALAAPDSVALPETITESTPCPVANCSQPDGGCHAAAEAPVPDGSFTMTCPKVTTCSDSSCHAWERLSTHYLRPSDFSMNLWILVPVVLAVGLVLLIRKMR